MSAMDQLHDQLVDASAALAAQREAAEPATAPAVRRRSARPVRRTVATLCGAAVLAAGFVAVGLPGDDGPRTGVVAAVIPGPATAMADQISARRGILHVITGSTRTRTGSGPWQPLYDPALRDEAWVALDGSGWRDRVIDASGRATSDGLQRADGSEAVARRDGTVRTTPAPEGQTAESRLPRQAWGRFVGGQLTGSVRITRIGTESLAGRPVIVVRDADLDGSRLQYDYAFDEATGALRQVRQRISTTAGWEETRTDITTWTIEPDTQALRRTLTTLGPLDSPLKG